MILEGWKGCALHFERITGRSLSGDALRKWVDRDRELAAMIVTVNGRPTVDSYPFERWCRMQCMTRQPRLRRVVRALLNAGQMVLL